MNSLLIFSFLKEENMLKRTIKGLLIDVKNQTLQACLVNDTLDDYYKVLNCGCIDCVTRIINNKKYVIVCDDNALLKENQIPSFVTLIGNYIVEVIYGNIFICKSDDDGNLISLTEKEIIEILKCKGYINGKYIAVRTDLRRI